MSDAGAPPPSATLLRRLRREGTAIEADALRAVAYDVLPSLATADLRVGLLHSGGTDAELVLEEAERTVRVPLRRLAADMTAARVAPTVQGMGTALRAWVAARPVTDDAAAAAGIAVVAWTDPAREAVGWSVAVAREGVVLIWSPSPGADARTVHRTRSAATGRSFTVPVELRVDGQVALWSCPAAPVLGTATLVDPGRMQRDAARAGLRMRAAHVVISPGRSVACADAGVADRLAGLTGEACVRLPWTDLTGLAWL